MYLLALILVGLVIVEHVYIMVMEMFLWTTPRVRKTFGTSEAFAAESAPLAANQGLYNGFLAAGLIWGLIAGQQGVMTFFLACVMVAAIYGGITSSPRITLVQGLPALLATLALWLSSGWN
jgi:putative membrane protein